MIEVHLPLTYPALTAALTGEALRHSGDTLLVSTEKIGSKKANDISIAN